MESVEFAQTCTLKALLLARLHAQVVLVSGINTHSLFLSFTSYRSHFTSYRSHFRTRFEQYRMSESSCDVANMASIARGEPIGLTLHII